MYCKHCGKSIPDDSSFCKFCGNEPLGRKLVNDSKFELKCKISTKAILFSISIGIWIIILQNFGLLPTHLKGDVDILNGVYINEPVEVCGTVNVDEVNSTVEVGGTVDVSGVSSTVDVYVEN